MVAAEPRPDRLPPRLKLERPAMNCPPGMPNFELPSAPSSPDQSTTLASMPIRLEEKRLSLTARAFQVRVQFVTADQVGPLLPLVMNTGMAAPDPKVS